MPATVEIRERINKSTYNRTKSIIDSSKMSESEVFSALLEYAINTNVLSSIVSSREITDVPVVGYINDSAVTVLPANMYDEETDGAYDDLFPRR